MPKPNDLFVGILEFFAVLLPGAILAAISLPILSKFVFGSIIPLPGSDIAKWAAFLVTSHFLGHFAFFAGSYIDPLYNKIREWQNPYNNSSAYYSAKLVRDEFLTEQERKPLNTFQWSRSVLISTCPAAADDVHRLEADSKFFRSLLVVFAVAAAAFMYKEKFMEAGLSVLLLLPCFARYYERRLKSTTQAYIHVVALYRLGKLQPAGANGRSAA